MSKDLLASLNDLKNQLSKIEDSSLKTKQTIDEDKLKKIRVTNIDEKLASIKNAKINQLTLNIRGEQKVVAKETFVNSPFSTIIAKDIENYYSNEIFIDIDRNVFEEILQILRFYSDTEFKNLEISLFPKYRKFYRTIEEKNFFELEIKSFFTDESIFNVLDFVDLE